MSQAHIRILKSAYSRAYGNRSLHKAHLHKPPSNPQEKFSKINLLPINNSVGKKALQQNKAKEKLIVELLKENEKLKLHNQIFKNKILEKENEELLSSIEEEAEKSESNKLVLLYFLALYITAVFLLTSLIASLYNKIRYRQARSI